ncbi:MAG: transglutaminase N-terminal domain-containing protein, partial [Pseudomonadota bacterium]|nr:transglutaminase N-terminal domain-containing protein [Pseudomonadota bacterium]
MKYLIKHITAYKYASRVSHCYNLAQMIPRTTQRQTCINSKIEVTPDLAM